MTTRRPPRPLSRRGIAVRAIAAIALVGGSLASDGCVSRTLGNQGLEGVPAAHDTLAVGAMIVTPSNLALGQRILRFDNSGVPAERVARRKEAENRMAATCAGDYEVGAEGAAAVDGVVTRQAGGAEKEASPFWYIQFTCVRDARGTSGSTGRQPR